MPAGSWRHGRAVRVAIVTESLPPEVNGVANSVARIIHHLADAGHEVLVVAPQPRMTTPPIRHRIQATVIRVPSVPMPGYPGVRLAVPNNRIASTLRDFRPDVLHLASPFVLGAWALGPARRLDIPVVAAYQTDVPGFARAYRLGFTEEMAWRWIRRIHSQVARTLAPSNSTASDLVAHGVPRVWLWRRGVDLDQFDPSMRSGTLRRALAPGGETIVGYVGRLAPEKRVDLLAETALMPGIRVVVVGDGPTRTALERSMPRATFLGSRHGTQLARLYASFDIFVHTGPHETFCQTVQEAMASGLPVVAPDRGGPRDLVEAERTGHLVQPYSGGAIARAVASLGSDPARRNAYGLAAREAVMGRGWAAIVDELVDHYRGAIGTEAASARTAVPA